MYLLLPLDKVGVACISRMLSDSKFSADSSTAIFAQNLERRRVGVAALVVERLAKRLNLLFPNFIFRIEDYLHVLSSVDASRDSRN
jgi:hypothetical protein